MITSKEIAGYSRSYTLLVFCEVKKLLRKKYSEEYADSLVAPLKPFVKKLKHSPDEQSLTQLKQGLVKLVRLCRIPFLQLVKT